MPRTISLRTMLLACGLAIVVGRLLPLDRLLRITLASPALAQSQPTNDGKLRIIIFGAHPDDAEYFGAGVAMKWARAGHHVKLVSATNGDIGHWQIGGRTARSAPQERGDGSIPPHGNH